MNSRPSTDEHTGGSNVPQTETQKIITEIKTLKKENKMATYARIIEEVEAQGDGESVSLSTVRRVFATGSESKSSSFSYDHVLLPIRDALLRLKEKDYGGPVSPDLIDALKSIILVQSEENARLQDLNEHLEKRVTFLLEQIALKDRRMDEKDQIIQRFMSGELTIRSPE